jgi:hypothetical protein
LTRRAFKPITVSEDGSYSHEAEPIQAVSRVWLANTDVIDLDRLVATLKRKTPVGWKAESNTMSLLRGETPGSGGRPAYLTHLIIEEYNKRLRRGRLADPTRITIE